MKREDTKILIKSVPPVEALLLKAIPTPRPLIRPPKTAMSNGSVTEVKSGGIKLAKKDDRTYCKIEKSVKYFPIYLKARIVGGIFKIKYKTPKGIVISK